MDGWGQRLTVRLRLAVRLIVEEVLEAEARDRLGRERRLREADDDEDRHLHKV
jgi:hypothetical protein